MIKKKTFSLLAFMAFVIPSWGQVLQRLPVEFAYDAAGNRILRHVVVLENRSGNDAKGMKQGASEEARYEEAAYDGWVEDMRVNVYPNPTKGRVTVELLNADAGMGYTARVYDSHGRRLYERTGMGGRIEIDLERYPVGYYIVELQAGDNRATWKIVKQ
ncbi:MAG: T9SS type A sorting domain-containing protein [Bacteroidales bacterium]|nr:T9SS type A sorting domain-containing protein [Bacteroidales bacterium]